MPRPTIRLGLPRRPIPHSGRRAARPFSAHERQPAREARPLRKQCADARRRSAFALILHPLCLASLLFLAGCQSAQLHFVPDPNRDYSRGMAHLVREGDTLSAIASYYRRDLGLLARLNDLKPPYLIRKSTHLYIPPSNSYQVLQYHPRMMDHIRAFRKRCDSHLDANKPPLKYAKTTKFDAPSPGVSSSLPKKTASRTKIHSASAAPKSVGGNSVRAKSKSAPVTPPRGARFNCDLPLKKFTYMRGFSVSNWLKPHRGVDLAADMGDTIYAAAPGQVLSSEKFGSLGNMVLIDHGSGFSSLYAHASKNLVKKGDRVRRGQPIAKVGSTGRSTGPHLHFELRYNGQAIDPEKHLPPLGKNEKRTASR